MPVITLTTDYGTRDYYVGALKGVIAGIAPSAIVVDVTHEIQPYDVLHGAFVLWRIWPCYPPGTIHVVVVDPGVGSSRRILLGLYGGQYVIAPDNGLMTLLHRDSPPDAVYVVENRKYFLPNPSSTFHGRDVMAPVAAHLANGVAPTDMGGSTDRLEILSIAHQATAGDAVLAGAVLHVDRFGTLITNISGDQIRHFARLHPGCEVWVNGAPVGPIRETFSDVGVGEPLALLGAAGLLEIAINRGRGVDRFGPPQTVCVEVRDAGTDR